MQKYLPEGKLINTTENKYFTSSATNLIKAAEADLILEGIAETCDTEHNLIVSLPFGKALIPRTEGAIGIEDGTTRDIALLSRVGKPIAFKVLSVCRDGTSEYVAVLSRRAAQQDAFAHYIDTLENGSVVPAKVTHLESFGCFVDLACGIPSLIPIDAISVSRISHPSDRFYNGQDIFVIIKSVSGNRICLSHKELLGTWEENAAKFKMGETVGGIVRTVEKYGIFIELTPNLAGLAELYPGAKVGQSASVYIKALIPDKMKVKLSVVDLFDSPKRPSKEIEYFITEGKVNYWKYSTPRSEKLIESYF